MRIGMCDARVVETGDETAQRPGDVAARERRARSAEAMAGFAPGNARTGMASVSSRVMRKLSPGHDESGAPQASGSIAATPRSRSAWVFSNSSCALRGRMTSRPHARSPLILQCLTKTVAPGRATRYTVRAGFDFTTTAAPASQPSEIGARLAEEISAGR